MSTTDLLIKSDVDAWDALSRLLTEIDSDFSKIKLDGWPVFDVTSKRGQAEIDTSTMKSFLAFQDGLYRAFLLSQVETTDLRSLSEEERRSLEISVKISEGSSIFKVDLEENFKNWASQLAEKMTGRQIVALLLVGGLIFAGQSVWKMHLSENANIRMAELDNEQQKESLRTFVELSEQETERINILSEAFSSFPEMQNVEIEADKARQEFMKQLPKDAEIIIEGIPITAEALAELTTPERSKKVQERISNVFTVERAHTTRNGFVVRLKSTTSEQSFSATFGDIFESEDERKLVKDAFWDKTPIELSIDATLRDGVIISAVIVSAGS